MENVAKAGRILRVGRDGKPIAAKSPGRPSVAGAIRARAPRPVRALPVNGLAPGAGRVDGSGHQPFLGGRAIIRQRGNGDSRRASARGG